MMGLLFYKRAGARMALQKYEEAVADCDKAVALCPSNYKARIRRSRSLIALGSYAEAVKDLEFVAHKHPRAPTVKEELGRAHDLWKQAKSKERRKAKAAAAAEQQRKAAADREAREADERRRRQRERERREQQRQRKAKADREAREADERRRRQRERESRYGTRSSSSARAGGDGTRSSQRQAAAPPPAAPAKVDHYTQLGIKKDATAGAIKKAYRKMALKWHPDKNRGNAEAASERFKAIGEAYNCLKSPQARKRYDRAQRRARGYPSDHHTRARGAAARGAYGGYGYGGYGKHGGYGGYGHNGYGGF